MLSFIPSLKARPVAIVKGGKYNKKIIYLYTDKVFMEDDDPFDSDSDSDSDSDLLAELDNKSDRERQNIIDSKRTQKRKKDLKKGIITDNNFKLIGGELLPIPNPDKRECIFITGPAGSGKSTWASMYIKNFVKMFPEREFFMISKLDEDEVLDKLDPVRIDYDDEDFVEMPVIIEELADSLILFDDTDTINDKIIMKSVNDLKDNILELGRHEDIYILITSHLATRYKETRTVLNEANAITIFPHGSGGQQIRYCLKKYFGLENDQLKVIKNLPSRWVTLYKTYPNYVLYSKGIYLI